MSEQTQDLVNLLELRIKELTQANRQLQRRAVHLEAAAQIGHVISSALDITTLNKRAVKIIKDLFGLYHVSVFLIDVSGQWALLSEAAGKASRKLKQARYRLPLDDNSSVGWVGHHQKPFLSYRSHVNGGEDRAVSINNHLLPGTRSEIALPLITNHNLLGVLDLQSTQKAAFDQEDITTLQKLADQIAMAIETAGSHHLTTDIEGDRAKLLFDVGISLNANLDLDDILTKAVGLTDRLGGTAAEIFLLTDTNETYFRSSIAKRNRLDQIEQRELVRRTLDQEVIARSLEANQVILVSDTKHDKQWQFLEYKTQIRSLFCAPIIVEQWQLRGIILFAHTNPDYFERKTLTLLKSIIPQITIALKNSSLLRDMQSNLRETHLMLDISRSLSAISSFEEIYDALEQSVKAAGADRSVLYICDEYDDHNAPIFGQIVFVSGLKPPARNELIDKRFPLTAYETLNDLVQTQEPLVITNLETEKGLSLKEQEFFGQFGACSFVINPLITGGQVVGLLAVEYQTEHPFTERELAVYRTLSNQTTTAMEQALQIHRTERALAETQTLYRTGRVLAGTDTLQDILQEALVEFVYSFGLDQGGITLLTPDKQFGQLRAYIENSQLHGTEKLRFPIRDDIVYQQMLLSGQAFFSLDVAGDTRLAEFRPFNKERPIKSTLQVPIIIQGETVGWVGVDAVNEPHNFTQQDIDLARALVDQIAIAIQNHWLLEQTERRAEQLKAVANVGEAVTGLMDLNEVLKITVDLIRDRFGFYHVSIFLLDEQREWAVVRASTGKVGKIMVERPHRLGVGSNSIVGFVTEHAKPRIALDVGEDAVYFDNPLLPDTRSEMALPLISRGIVIGALDVQSVEANAFTGEDVETLQIMANQTTAAIENARLFEQTQRRLSEQAMLYRIGTRIGGTLQLQETTDILVLETARALDVSECALTLIEEADTAYTVSDYVHENSSFPRDHGTRQSIEERAGISKILDTLQELVIHIDDPDDGSWPFEYLRMHQGTAMAIVPILLRNEIIGLLEVYDDKTGRRLKQEDVALLDSIALQAANTIENARLFAQTQKTLDRAQTLHRISSILSMAVDLPATFETVLGEYLHVLGLKQGRLMLLDRATNTTIVSRARYINGQAVTPNLVLAVEDDLVLQTLQAQPIPLIVEDPQTHPLTKDSAIIRGEQHVTAMLFVPLVIREQVIGTIVIDVTTEEGYLFNQDDLDIGESIADQLTIWLENRRLLSEAQFGLRRLQTAAEVSRAATSILDVDELIDASVNLIRDRFGFYYVGLFLLDAAREWAILRAGTGEAGRIQLERNHRLKIGGESMIGWSVHNRTARIALDVGEEAVRFKNPILPDTHSEMALPLISRDQVLGALTVQSIERGAFSDEDITQLQTMADQLANAIENARLFTQSQEALSEAEALYQITQQLTTARDEEAVYQLAIEAIAKSGVDSSGLYMYLNAETHDGVPTTEQIIEQKVVWTATGSPAVPNGTRFRAADFVIEQLVPRHDSFLVADINDSTKITAQLRAALEAIGVTTLLVLPLSTYQARLGFLLVAYKSQEKSFTQPQIRFFTTIVQQLVTTLENLRFLDASQRRAQREEVIREITLKIRNAVDIDDILKTTVTELGKILGTSRGNIVLDVGTLATPPATKLQAKNGSQKRSAPDGAISSSPNVKSTGAKEKKKNGQ